MSERPNYAVAACGKHTVIRLSGRLEVTEIEGLSDLLGELIARDDTQIVLDLSGVGFMSSSMIGLLLRTRSQLAEKQGRLVLACVPDEVHQVLKVSRLDEVFEIVPDVDGLIESE